MPAHAEIKGLPELLDQLDSGLSDDALLSAARKGLQRVLIRMKDDAKRNAPYDDDGDGTHLRDTIHYKTDVTKKDARGELVASSEHAVFVEMGTGPVGERGLGASDVSPQMKNGVTYSAQGWSYPTGEVDAKGKPVYVYTEGMPPRPYLYPAYKAHEGKIKSEIRKCIEERMNGE